jgi:hypothetical protein
VKKKNVKYILISLLLALSIPLLDIITVRYECDYFGDAGPVFYGFPFKYRTALPWINSLSGVFYISGFLYNFLFYFVLIFSSILLLNKLIKKLIFKKILRIIGYVIVFMSLLLALSKFLVIDWKFEWKNRYFENRGEKPLECERHFEFFDNNRP